MSCRAQGAAASLMGLGTSMVAVAIYSADPAFRLRLEQLLRAELRYTAASVTHNPRRRRHRLQSDTLEHAALRFSALRSRAPAEYQATSNRRGCLGHTVTLRYPSPLIKPVVPISGTREIQLNCSLAVLEWRVK